MAAQNYRKRGGLITIFMMVIWMLAILKFIPLSGMVSVQSISVFSVCFQFFLVLFFLSGYAVPSFVSKWISLRISRGQYKNAKRVFTTSFMVSLILNFILGILFFFLADVYAGTFIHVPYSIYVMKCMAVAFPIYGMITVLNGYFQGMGTMMPTCVAGILEQIVTLPLALIFGHMFYGYGSKVAALLQEENYIYAYSAMGIVLAIVIGALVSLLFLVLVYFIYQKTFKKNLLKDTTKNFDSQAELTAQFFTYIVPNALPALFLILGMWLNQKFYFSHVFVGGSLKDALVSYGVFYGKYQVLIFIPVLFLVAACYFLTPVVEKLRARESYHQLRTEFQDGMKQILMIAGILSLVFTLLSGVLGGLFEKSNSELLTKQLLFGSFAILFYSVAIYTTAFVKGLNILVLSIVLWLVCLVLQSILVYVLLATTKLEILAVVIGFFVYPLFISAVNYLLVRKELY